MSKSLMPAHLTKAMDTPTKLQRLIAYLNDGEGKVQLNEELQKLLDRYDYMDTNIRKYLRKSICVERQVKKFEISPALANNDFYNTKEVFNSVPRANKNYEFEFLLDLGYQLWTKAIDTGNLKAAAAVYKTICETRIKMLSEQEMPQEKEAPAVIIISADPSTLGIKALPEKELEKRIKFFMREAEQKKKIKFEIEDAETLEE